MGLKKDIKEIKKQVEVELDSISIEEQQELIKRLETDPIYFIEIFIGRKLSNKQREFIEATKTHKHVVAIWSRQTGKSTVIASYIVWRLLYGPGKDINGEHMYEHIAVVAPIKEQHVMIYGKIRSLIEKNEYIFSYIEKMNSEEIIMKNGNEAKFMSASPGAHIRGYTATCIVIDESQDVIDEKYNADIMPFGSTTNALVLEAGTPKTKNHFYTTVYNKAKDIIVVRQPWFECPFISKEYVMSQKEISPDALWRQEYLCEFVEEGVLVFPSRLFEPETKAGTLTGRWNLAEYSYITKVEEFTKERMIMINNKIKEEGAQYVAGLDLGRQNDNTVYSIYRIDKRPITLAVQIYFDLGTNYKDIAAWISVFHKVYQPIEMNIDYTNEKAFIEILQENNVPVVRDAKMIRGAIQFTSKNKSEMVNTTKILLENFQLCLPKDSEKLISQFLNQQFEISDGKKIRFFHPSQEHDDALWSTLLALKNVTLLTFEDIVTWSNPWEKFAEQVHSINNRPTAREVLLANAKYTKERRQYQSAEDRRMFRFN